MKRKIYIWLLLVGFICISTVFASAQPTDRTLKYDVHALGMKIGELTVNEHISGDKVIVEAITNVDVKIIFNYRVKYFQRSIYHNGELISSHLQTMKNGEVHSDTWLKKDSSDYLLIKEGDSTIIHDKIFYSGSLLYFNEPLHTSTIYMEINGEKDRIKQTADHIYVITDNNNREKNKYTYKNGILQKSEIKHALATIYVERKQNEPQLD